MQIRNAPSASRDELLGCRAAILGLDLSAIESRGLPRGQSDIARSYGVAHIAIGRLTHAPHSEDHAAAAASPHTKSR